MVTLHDALEYHDRGFAVIPTDKAKKALYPWKGYQKTPPSQSLVRQWFGSDDQAGIACIMGDVSRGLVCRDYDDLEAYERWANAHPQLAKQLPTAATPRPGRHVYARADLRQIRDSSDSRSIMPFNDGELRGGGYCLLPPSENGNGAYRWLVALTNEIPTVDLHEAGFLPCNKRELRKTKEYKRELKTCSLLLHGCAPTVQTAIAATLPATVGKRHRAVFDFARELKGLAEYAAQEAQNLKAIVRVWHQAALPVIGTKPFEDTWLDFVEGWRKVKHPKGEIINMVFARAERADLPEVARAYETPQVVLLIRLCRELQRHHGEGSFPLDARTAGKLLGVEHTTAWRWLRLLQHDRIIEQVSQGSRASRRANYYRYIHEV